VDGVVFFDVHLPGEYWEQASAHEGFHVLQYGAPELSDGWVERQPGYDQIRLTAGRNDSDACDRDLLAVGNFVNVTLQSGLLAKGGRR
jgi:hypothetical protein